MKKRTAVLLIVFLVLIAFANNLANDFIGDAQSLFVGNAFYKNPSNLKKLLSKNFVMTPGQFDPPFDGKEQEFSGCISWRPIPALTFFTDYALWKNNPAGHHATDVLLHLAVSLLVFAFVLKILGGVYPAFLTTLIFALHPLQSEVVAGLGYRSDLLTAFFFLGALILARQLSATENKVLKRLCRWASYAAFFLALLSKETALVFPLVLLTYDLIFTKSAEESVGKFLRGKIAEYAGFVLVLLVFCWLYFFVFPSAHYPKVFSLGLDPTTHALTEAKIFLIYLFAIFNPFTVHPLPPLYTPVGSWGAVLVLAVVLAALALAVWSIFRKENNQRLVGFALLWFVLTLLPAANFMPLPNPVAFRFLYLPFVGAAIILALALQSFINFSRARFPQYNVTVLAPAVVAIALLSVTVTTNSFFKNNFSSCREMLRNYPDSSRPHWILGINLFERGRFVEAREEFERYLAADPRNPFVPSPKTNFVLQLALGRCYVDNPDLALAKFNEAIALRPDYPLAYVDASKACLLKNNFPLAHFYATAALKINDKIIPAYVYAIHSLAEMKDFPAARKLLTRAQALNREDPSLIYVETFLKSKELEP